MLTDPVDARRALEQALSDLTDRLLHNAALYQDAAERVKGGTVTTRSGQRHSELDVTLTQAAADNRATVETIRLLSAAAREETPACPKHARKLELYCADCDAEAERRGMLRQPPPRPETGETLAPKDRQQRDETQDSLRMMLPILMAEAEHRAAQIPGGNVDKSKAYDGYLAEAIVTALWPEVPPPPAPAERERRE